MSFLQDVLNIVIKYYPQLLKGVGNTMLLALTGTVAGLVIGLFLAIICNIYFSHKNKTKGKAFPLVPYLSIGFMAMYFI